MKILVRLLLFISAITLVAVLVAAGYLVVTNLHPTAPETTPALSPTPTVSATPTPLNPFDPNATNPFDDTVTYENPFGEEVSSPTPADDTGTYQNPFSDL